MKLETITILGRDHSLAGLHYVPEGQAKAAALILAHGFTSSKASMDILAGYLAGRGYETVTFDFAGHKLGGTGGAMQRAAQAAENLQDVLKWFRERTAGRRIVLIGHSMGGAASLAVAAREQENASEGGAELAGVVSIAMGLNPSQGFSGVIGRAMLQQRSDYVTGAPALALVAGVDRLVEEAANIGGLPVLLVAAKQDVIVPLERIEALSRLMGNASLVQMDSSHLEAPDRARAAILQWLERMA